MKKTCYTFALKYEETFSSTQQILVSYFGLFRKIGESFSNEKF